MAATVTLSHSQKSRRVQFLFIMAMSQVLWMGWLSRVWWNSMHDGSSYSIATVEAEVNPRWKLGFTLYFAVLLQARCRGASSSLSLRHAPDRVNKLFTSILNLHADVVSQSRHWPLVLAVTPEFIPNFKPGNRRNVVRLIVSNQKLKQVHLNLS